MKRILTIVVVLTGLLGGLIGGCTSAKSSEPAFKNKTDSVDYAIYKDSVHGPFLVPVVYSIGRYFRVTDSVGKKGEWIVDTAFYVKQQSDTLKAPDAHHTYIYTPVSKRYVQFIEVPRKN